MSDAYKLKLRCICIEWMCTAIMFYSSINNFSANSSAYISRSCIMHAIKMNAASAFMRPLFFPGINIYPSAPVSSIAIFAFKQIAPLFRSSFLSLLIFQIPVLHMIAVMRRCAFNRKM